MYIALRVFGIPYPDYIARTTRQERALYGYFMALEAAKEERAYERNKLTSDAAYRAHSAIEMPARH